MFCLRRETASSGWCNEMGPCLRTSLHHLGPRNEFPLLQLNEVASVSSTLSPGRAPSQKCRCVPIGAPMKTAAVVLLALVGGSAQAKDTFYRCGHDSSYEEISMAIQNDGSATEILIRSQKWR